MPCIVAEYKASHPGTQAERTRQSNCLRISNLSKQQNTALLIPGETKLTKTVVICFKGGQGISNIFSSTEPS
jgi:hypothetical protein